MDCCICADVVSQIQDTAQEKADAAQAAASALDRTKGLIAMATNVTCAVLIIPFNKHLFKCVCRCRFSILALLLTLLSLFRVRWL